MSVVYSLEEDKIKQTITIPEKQEVRDLGKKEKVISELEAEISKCQGIIDSYTTLKAEIQAKLDAINAIE